MSHGWAGVDDRDAFSRFITPTQSRIQETISNHFLFGRNKKTSGETFKRLDCYFFFSAKCVQPVEICTLGFNCGPKSRRSLCLECCSRSFCYSREGVGGGGDDRSLTKGSPSCSATVVSVLTLEHAANGSSCQLLLHLWRHCLKLTLFESMQMIFFKLFI